MVLSKSALGPQAARLRVNPRFGFLTNAQSASADPDPAVTAASLTNGGRLFGYAREFRLSGREFASALLRGAGLLQFRTRSAFPAPVTVGRRRTMRC
jgi:hypothetical protein